MSTGKNDAYVAGFTSVPKRTQMKKLRLIEHSIGRVRQCRTWHSFMQSWPGEALLIKCLDPESRVPIVKIRAWLLLLFWLLVLQLGRSRRQY